MIALGNGAERLQAFQGASVDRRLRAVLQLDLPARFHRRRLISYRYLEIEGEHHAEYYGLILLAQCGMYFLAAGTDLVTLFIGLELMALCFYVMVGFLRREKRSNEAAMKYLLLGVFSSGFWPTDSR